MITNEEINKALDRIARTEDGYLLYLYFQKTLCAITTDETVNCALPFKEGRRKLAAELMSLMAQGIEQSGRPSNAPVTFAVAGARAISRPSGAGRRVTLDTAIPGYDAPGTPSGGRPS